MSIVLRLTLLPAPVAPATSKCGIVFKSVVTGAPKMSLPSASVSFDRALANASLVTTSYGEAAAGRLGVLGPTRMDYPGTMVAVAAVARYVGRHLEDQP